jgi:hypothetical protein
MVPYIGKLKNIKPNFDSLVYQTKTADYTMAEADCGILTIVTVDAKTITLPATVVDYSFLIMNGCMDGTCAVTISPNASDKIMGNGYTSADNKDIVNTKATAKYGDYVKLVGDGANGWMITEIAGIWAKET